EASVVRLVDFLPVPLLRTMFRRAVGAGATASAGDFAAAGESGKKRTATKIRATTMRLIAIIVFFLLSAPNSISDACLLISFQLQLQLDDATLLAAQLH